MKHTTECMLKNNLYWCPKCKECYCQHKEDWKTYSWRCKNGEKISFKIHAKEAR